MCRTLPPGSSSTSALSTAYLSMRSLLSSPCDIEVIGLVAEGTDSLSTAVRMKESNARYMLDGRVPDVNIE